MKKTVKLLMSISLCMCMMMTLFSFNINAADNDNVKLYYANAQSKYYPGESSYNQYTTVGKIAVKDLGDDAKVFVHFVDCIGEWRDIPATYLKKSSDGYKIYTFETDRNPWRGYYNPYECTFAIRYEVNGQIYWDNNNGKNYFVGLSNVGGNYPRLVLSKSKLLFDGDQYYDGYVTGRIVVNDTADNVTVRYKIKGTDTYKEVKGYKNSYQNPDNSYEYWSFKIQKDLFEEYDFTIEYEKDGHTYVDDNFGDHYYHNKY
ncbi:glycogen-binding regulatory subunit of S/T protein phosphatase I [Vallitalea longa]|uniref:Glycogen-binding regulatory subunit of S/T protein phosphatase I n=1 Tax=Vallitalea longa TaxID=2936439 RepID=A0A9W5Y7V7_9FIRM|nr:hypothetical protein [Vallitalea longa]GKX27974.1 glycogen-binding regulatory subunit of S/T protein phosphatase I [Vallitalea longa]